MEEQQQSHSVKNAIFSIITQAYNFFDIGTASPSLSSFPLVLCIHATGVVLNYSTASTQFKSCALNLTIISGYENGQVVLSKWVFHDYLVVCVLAMTE